MVELLGKETIEQQKKHFKRSRQLRFSRNFDISYQKKKFRAVFEQYEDGISDSIRQKI